ncbi:MAG: hypothetical protein LBQ38_00545 [Spirochaetaceae bacterium]|jgi:hypothetical protein|nr:hypothetical protein [Spirochaetaceae bacterium]
MNKFKMRKAPLGGAGLLCLFLVFGFAAGACNGKPAGYGRGEDSGVPGGIRFSGGKFGFLFVDESPVGANKARLSLVDYEGGKAVRAELSGSGVPYIVIDADSLLGQRVRDLREMLVTIRVEHPSGEFYAVSGDIYAYSGPDRLESADPWSVYLPNKNPNIARAVLEGEAEWFVPGAYNFFILTRKVDNALGEGKEPSNLLITGLRFLDAEGRDLPVNPDAGFNAPEGFGIPDRSNLFAVAEEAVIPGAEGSSKNWGQAVGLSTVKNDGPIDPGFLIPEAIVTVYYTSAAAPELILQSWTDGAPGTAGWAKVAPAAVNDSGTTAQFLYGDLAAAFGTENFSQYLDRIYVGDTGRELTVYAVTLSGQR